LATTHRAATVGWGAAALFGDGGGLPAMRGGGYRATGGIRIDGLQGAVALAGPATSRSTCSSAIDDVPGRSHLVPGGETAASEFEHQGAKTPRIALASLAPWCSNFLGNRSGQSSRAPDAIVLRMFTRLRVVEVRRETAACVSLAFDVPEELRAGFAFAPGQYLTLRRIVGSEEVRRQLLDLLGAWGWGAAGRDQACARRGVLGIRQYGARGRDVVEAMAPEGAVRAPVGDGTYLAIAAGSGITPVMSVLRNACWRGEGGGGSCCCTAAGRWMASSSAERWRTSGPLISSWG